MTLNMSEGNTTKILLAFTMPMIAGNIFQQLYNVVDSVIVGRYVGFDALAAVGASFPVVFMLIAVVMGLTMGSSTVISQLFGAGEHARVRRAVFTSLIALVAVSLACAALGLLVAQPVLRLINTPADIFADCVTYLNIFFTGSIFLFLYNGFSAVLRALGDSKSPLYFLIIAALINIVLDYVFVVYLLMGVAGVAWATLISQAVSVVLCFIYILRRVPALRFEKADLVFDRQLLGTMMRYAVPSTIQQFIVSFGAIAIQGLVNSYDTVVIAGYTASLRIDQIAMMPIMNFSLGLSTFTAQNIGAGTGHRIKEGYRVTLLCCIVVSGLVTGVAYLFGEQIIGLFLDVGSNSAAVDAVIQVGVTYLRVVSPFYVLMGMMFTANGVLRGSGDVNVFMLITLLNLAIRVASAYILAAFIGPEAIWWSLPVGWAAAAVLSHWRYFSGKWRNNSLTSHIGSIVLE